ncbi:MAG: L-histidine N(alpha)-methyltransferase [Gemmatimonadota bacterium]
MTNHAFDRERMRREVAAGLGRTPREISPKYFYDERGSRLFDEITRLDEYYPTRTERELLERFSTVWITGVRPHCLVELGAGSADKTRILLDAMHAAGTAELYVPVDISADYLEDVAAGVDRAYPELEVRPAVADLTGELALDGALPRPLVVAFLGSTLGNFDREAAGGLLRRVRALLRPGDRFLLGLDLVKQPAVLEAAYNDADGVTAAFNLNVLDVLNRELGADFRPEAFRHHAFWNAEESRIEMHLVTDQPQTVSIPGVGTVEFAAGEHLRTEISRKFNRPGVEAMLAAAGLRLVRWETDVRDWFALAVGAPA